MKLNEKIKNLKSYVQRNQRKCILIMCCVVIVGGLVAGTLAWLTSMSKPIVNSFIGSDLTIDLQETTGADNGYQFQMIPGDEIEKNPKITVFENSEACWVFLQVKESSAQGHGSGLTLSIGGQNVVRTEKYLTYELEDLWTLMSESDAAAAGFPVNDLIKYYYCKVGTEGNALPEAQTLPILKNEKVYVNFNLVNQELTDTQLNANPVRISFKPAAVQQMGFSNPVDAGAEVSNLFTATAD